MPETTPLIKAALNLRGGAGFDVYVYTIRTNSKKNSIIKLKGKHYEIHIILHLWRNKAFYEKIMENY